MSAETERTDARILRAANAIVRKQGPDALTFDAVARAVGVTKQAVLYWYPNRARLIEAMVQPALELESVAGIAAVRGRRSANTAIQAFVEALAEFHTSDLDRFRLMYVTPQIGMRSGNGGVMVSTLGRVHPATTAMYDALAERLVAHGRCAKLGEARRAAAAIHTAVLGTVLRIAMADRLKAPLRYRDDAVISSLVSILVPPEHSAGAVAAG